MSEHGCQCADVRYFAGLFDGEGCVSVSQYVADGRERFHCDLYFGVQNRLVLDEFRQLVSVGSISRRASIWMYQASGANAAHVVRTLLPHLRIKREAAVLFVEFAATFSSRNRKPVPDDIMLVRRDLSERIRQIMRADAESFRVGVDVHGGIS